MRNVLIGAVLLTVILSVGLGQAAGEVSSSPEYIKANKMFAEGKFADALALYNGILASPPEGLPPADVYGRIGDCHFRLGNYQKAGDAYRAALEKQKPAERAPTQYWIGFCSFLSGKDAEAVSEFLKIPQLYPSSGMWVTTAYYWAGRASERLGKKDQATEFYRKAGGKGNSTQERYALKKAEGVKKEE